jgi:glutamate formiminotransferase / 5-formyltetrahydrofolate cyclo-ligase
VLECVPNVSEGRDPDVIRALVDAGGTSLLDVHSDADHHRSVLTLAGPTDATLGARVRDVARAVARWVDLDRHEGVHPRFGALDVVPFVALDGAAASDAAEAARRFAEWIVAELAVPVFFYGDADPASRPLPDARRDAFRQRPPDLGPVSPHPRLGAVAVGARPVMIAVNCVLDTYDLTVASRIARAVRTRDGGLPAVRALAFPLASTRRSQVSMNLVDLSRTGLETACTMVEAYARTIGHAVVEIELVGLLPAAELSRCSTEFRKWAGIGTGDTIEARLAVQDPPR